MFENSVNLDSYSTTDPLDPQRERLVNRRPLGQLLVKLLGIDRREVTFEKRKFTVTNKEIRQQLELAGICFIQGYHIALLCNQTSIGSVIVQVCPPELQGFAFEGAAMSLAQLD